ncbi:MAG TPA: hypothetical protein VFQ51_04405 [Vicinamibacteria bacterium]|nr:hypothetical protein [Vicinamibacteria bacterium]
MRHGDTPVEPDDALRDVLERWEADEMPAGAQERMLARYRRAQVPWWRRLSAAPLRIALPVAVSLLLVVGAAVLTLRSASEREEQQGAVAAPSTVAASAPAPRSSLAGFQPMDEVTATVVTERP